MTERRQALTPEALLMMDTIARTGSFAAAARELELDRANLHRLAKRLGLR